MTPPQLRVSVANHKSTLTLTKNQLWFIKLLLHLYPRLLNNVPVTAVATGVKHSRTLKGEKDSECSSGIPRLVIGRMVPDVSGRGSFIPEDRMSSKESDIQPLKKRPPRCAPVTKRTIAEERILKPQGWNSLLSRVWTRVLRTMGPRQRKWLEDEEFHDLYSSPNTVVIKPDYSYVRQHTLDRIQMHSKNIGQTGGNRPMDNMKMDNINNMWWKAENWTHVVENWPMTGSCKHSTQASGSINCGENLDWLSPSQYDLSLIRNQPLSCPFDRCKTLHSS